MYVECKGNNRNTSITISKGLADRMDNYQQTHPEYRSRSEVAVHAILKLIEMNYNNGGGVGG